MSRTSQVTHRGDLHLSPDREYDIIANIQPVSRSADSPASATKGALHPGQRIVAPIVRNDVQHPTKANGID